VRIRKDWNADESMYGEDVLAAAKVADALAHPVRIEILRHILQENLARRAVTNKDIVQSFNYAQSTISQHIAQLLIGGLLIVRKRGTSSCYYARIGKLSVFMDTLKKIKIPDDFDKMPDFLGSGIQNADPSDPVFNPGRDFEWEPLEPTLEEVTGEKFHLL